MKARRMLFAIALVGLVLGPGALDRGPGGRGPGHMVQWPESLAAAGEVAMGPDGGGRNAGTDGTEEGFPGSRLTPQEIRQLLASHNEARAEVDLAPLSWSGSLALYAQEWADHLASTSRRMEHRPHSGTWKQEHGENLFMGTAGYYGVADAVAAWESEKSAYDGETINLSNLSAYGHYTQLVWKNTKRIGCAKAESAGNVIIVCNYDPPGNVLNQTPY